MSSDLQALRQYVMGPSSQAQAESTIRLMVSHSNLKASFNEIRLDLHMTIDSVKSKLSFHCGTPPSAMVLELKNEQGRLLCTMSDDSKKLGFFSPQDGYIIHIIDTDPQSMSANGWLEDVSKVEKYNISEEDYNKRDNTYRKFKEEKLRVDPNWSLAKEIATRKGQPEPAVTKKVHDPEYLVEEAADVSEGCRCEVEGGKRGVVRYVGKVEGLPVGWWVGVEYDEPVGKNDGTYKGKKVFECRGDRYGGFVRPNLVKTGDEYRPFDEDFEFSDGDEI